MESKELSKVEMEMVKTIDGEILKRTEYGMRVANIGKGWTKLSWSNAGEEWWCDNVRVHGSIKLDANEIVVPYAAKDVIPIRELLIELPLFHCSTEAIERGYVSRGEATLEWVRKQLEMR